MQAVETEPFRAVAAAAPRYRQTMMRLFGIPESEIAETLRVAEGQIGLDGLEVTTCLRRGELEIVIRADGSTEPAADALVALISERHGDSVFSTDGSSIEEQVMRLLEGRRLGVGESCTGGLLAARLTDRPGSSDYFAGSVVAYSNEAKSDLLGVPPEMIERHGAVSEEVAVALADGALERFAADTAIGLTGIAGPDGGTPGQAGRAGVLLRGRAPRRGGRARGARDRHPGLARRGARPLDDRRAPPAAAPAAARGRAGLGRR